MAKFTELEKEKMDILIFKVIDKLKLEDVAEIAKGFAKQSAHTALADIRESIEELKYYREHFLRC